MKAAISVVEKHLNYDMVRRFLLIGLTLASASILTLFSYRRNLSAKQYYINALLLAAGWCLVMFRRHSLKRLNKSNGITYTFIGLLALTSIQMLWSYSFRLPETLLALAFLIVLCSLVMGARLGLICTGLVSLGVLMVGVLELNGRLQPDLSWVDKDPNLGDAITYALIFIIIGLVAWLSSRDNQRSLQRALASEAALLDERDKLEIKVTERSLELERLQAKHLLELQRFAEFGRLSASLLHELASPLTAASLNLQQYNGKPSEVLSLAQKNLEQLQLYLISARRQLRGLKSNKRFNVKHELAHISTLLMPLARDANINIQFSQQANYWLYGDPVKFNQLISNLIVNAIDASKNRRSVKSKIITIKVTGSAEMVHIVVHDWGSGIKSENISHVFEPFYTTKSSNGRGLGIGLALVKAFVEEDFQGSIRAKSSPRSGTIFSVSLKRAD